MNIIGFIEQIDDAGVKGWAYCPDATDVHLDIRVSLDDLLIGSTTASEPREDLQRLGFGNGDHGFTVTLDIDVNPEDLALVEVLATAPDGEVLRLKRVKTDAPPPPEPAPPPPPGPLSGFPMPTADSTAAPVFVLGAARSGTSAMAQGLLKSAAYTGFEEGHFLWMIRRFLLTIHTYFEDNGEDGLPDRFTLLSRVPASYLADAMRAVFVSSMSRLFPAGNWLDKTPRPEMIEAAPIMQELWPNARFIFMRRRGLENVSSRLTKFPSITFEDHCRDWARNMEVWLRVRDLLAGAAMEIEQLSVALEPERTAEEVGSFLGLTEPTIRRLAKSFGADRPERTTEHFGKPLQIDQMGWTDLQIATFRRECGPMMAAFGYSYTSSYFARPVRTILPGKL